MTSSFPGDFTNATNISGEFIDNDVDTTSIDTDSGSNSGTQTTGEIASGTTTTISATDTLSAESDSSWVDGVDTITISLGGNPITVQPAATDTATSGGRLLKEKQGKLHIDILGDGTSLLSIVDNSGGTPTFDSSSSWSDSYSSGSWKQQSIAVEKQSDGTYKLAIKTTDVYNGTTNINWNVYSINSSGVLDWGNSSWGGITKHEADFNQDLNGDGVIGIAAEALTSVSTDTYGARLKRDSENGLYIDVDNDGSNLIAIVDNYGGTPTFDSSGSMETPLHQPPGRRNPLPLSNNLTALLNSPLRTQTPITEQLKLTGTSTPSATPESWTGRTPAGVASANTKLTSTRISTVMVVSVLPRR